MDTAPCRDAPPGLLDAKVPAGCAAVPGDPSTRPVGPPADWPATAGDVPHCARPGSGNRRAIGAVDGVGGPRSGGGGGGCAGLGGDDPRPGPGSGTRIVTTETGAPAAAATTPRTSDAIHRSDRSPVPTARTGTVWHVARGRRPVGGGTHRARRRVARDGGAPCWYIGV